MPSYAENGGNLEDDAKAEPSPVKLSDTAWIQGMRFIDLRKEDPLAVNCMIQFIYKLDYDICMATNTICANENGMKPIQSDLSNHVLVYKLAEVYEVKHLKALALQKLKRSLSQPNFEVDDFVTAASQAYDEMHEFFDDIRKEIIRGLHKHRKVLLVKESIKNLLCTCGIIAFDLLIYLDDDPWS